jgi:hypothetical protein
MAQVYAKNELAVFPLQPTRKIPLQGSHGHLEATTDLKQIDTWWTENKDYNIGAVPASKGCTVIDTDEKEGRQGGAHFDELCMKHTGKAVPATKIVQTVSNPPGHHRWYTGTVAWDGPAGLLGEGIDVKCHGYVVMPPSVIDGKAYTWSSTATRADLPQWIADTVKAAHAARSKPRSKSTLDGTPISREAFAAILSFLDPDVGYDQWRDTVAAIHASPVALQKVNGKWELLSDLELLDTAIRWSRGEYDRLGRYKDTHPSRYDSDDAVERVFLSMPPKAGGIGFGSLVKEARDAGYKGPISVSEEEAKAKLTAAAGLNAREQPSPDQIFIDELASLDIVAYGRRRKDAAKQLGIPVGSLDKAVGERHTQLAGEAEQPPLLPHWKVEPWTEPVDGDALVLEIVRRIQSHVVLRPEAALTIALWIILSWVHEDAATHSPILMVTSPEAECGKSTLLGLAGFLVRRSLPSVGVSPAALYRSIEKWQPTLIIDEADVAFVQNEDLRAVVNSGWTRGSGVLRCDGDDNEPRLFSTFCPKAIGLKGKQLPDTTASRAIVVELKRKLADEQVADFRHVDNHGLNELRQKIYRWALDNGEALSDANPDLPAGFLNRVAANWRILLAIADAAGGEWPEKARAAASGTAKIKATIDASIGVQLLSDIRNAFNDKADRIFSSTLIQKLISDPEKPWAEFRRGKSFTQKQLAKMLGTYGIVSEPVWIEGQSARGYKRAAFEDAWTRYLGASLSNPSKRQNTDDATIIEEL